MIAQIETRLETLKVKERNFQSPFRLHTLHGCVFAPWGELGALYAVETEDQYQHLNKKFPHIYWHSHVGTFNVVVSLPWFWGKALHWNLLERGIAGVAVLFFLFLPRVIRVRAETKCLPVAQVRLSVFRAVQHYAYGRDGATLWYLNILFSLCSWLLWTLSRGVQGDPRYILCLLMTLCVLFALANSLMILVRVLPTIKRV